MIFYLSSPSSQIQADYCKNMPVLVSFALYPKILDDYISSFKRVLIDSGAFSEMNSGKKVDGIAYRDWQQRWATVPHIDAIAGLDDIRGDWRRSLKNYEQFGGFPTFHETDPPELLEDLLPIARKRGGWLGVGLMPPRTGKWGWVRRTLDRIPDDLHVHVWAGGEYCGHPRVDSTDSTNWWRDAFKLKVDPKTKHLTPAECLKIVVERYRRMKRKPDSDKGSKISKVGFFESDGTKLRKRK